ncbi:hypothetical protein DPMN_137425 [Dreissena polymorpha]|uniref:Uncharacterized protein n=1 Tax=Dreissena polymorpha TaxID=45954 RepID=A0A9D4JIT5_DREPO|nr:hypothetical protein DPMN_137425 [Dreissena polymorpha]
MHNLATPIKRTSLLPPRPEQSARPADAQSAHRTHPTPIHYANLRKVYTAKLLNTQLRRHQNKQTLQCGKDTTSVPSQLVSCWTCVQPFVVAVVVGLAWEEEKGIVIEWLKKVSPIYIPMSGQHRAVLHSRSRADIHTNVGPTSNRIALPISGRCNYRCRADIHTDVGPTLRRALVAGSTIELKR